MTLTGRCLLKTSKRPRRKMHAFPRTQSGNGGESDTDDSTMAHVRQSEAASPWA